MPGGFPPGPGSVIQLFCNMKKLTFLALTAMIAALFAVSCSPVSIPATFRIFVNEVEARCPSYTAEDWAEANATLDRLTAEFKRKKITMSRSEVREVEEYLARFRELEANTPVLSERPPVEEVEVDVQGIEDFLKGDR